MKAGASLLLLSLLAGCVASPAAVGPTPMAATPSPLLPGDKGSVAPVPGISPTEWAIDEFGVPEPSPGPEGVIEGLPTLRLIQEGGMLRLTRSEYCGKPSEEAAGAFAGNTVRLEGTSYRGQLASPLVYELTYDPAARRFRGKRNGQAVWLAPGRSYPPRLLCTLAIRGQLFEGGIRFTRPAKVTVLSLNPSNPHESTQTVTDGDFRVDNVRPVAYRITVEAEGMAPRIREVDVVRGPEWLVNFGGPRDREDPEGWRYPLEPLEKPSPLPSGPSGTI